ncbi:MAG: DUF4136 domain-containing protein [Gammaproteobacteria bacterium]|nr:DUF4136 domain-containing protein [Gammaproteobacteria bacterium]
MIDVTDTENNKLIWRGINTLSISEYIEPGEPKALINETVENILQQYPPNK